MTKAKGMILDYGGTLDTGGCHWGRLMWHAYQRLQMPVSEEQFRQAYVYAERTLGKNPIVKPDFTFRETLETKLRLQQDYLRGEERGERREERKERTPLLSPEGEEEPPLGEVWRGSKPSVEEILSLLMEQVERHTAHSREVLSLLKQRMPLVLVSNFYGNIHTVLREFGLDGLFTHVVESAVVGVRKPDPRIFTLGVEALGLAPYEVTVVGDSMEKDIVPARQAGCHTVWLQGEQWSSAPVDTSAADRIITDIEQLL